MGQYHRSVKTVLSKEDQDRLCEVFCNVTVATVLLLRLKWRELWLLKVNESLTSSSSVNIFIRIFDLPVLLLKD